MEIMIAVSIALALAIVAIVLAAVGRSTSRKNHEEIKKQLDDCSTQIASLSDELKKARSDASDQGEALRKQIEGNLKQVNDAISKTNAAAKEYGDLSLQKSSEQLSRQVSILTKDINSALLDSRNYTDEGLQRSNAEYSKKLGDLAYVLQKVLEDNNELKKKLEFFTEIKEDSAQLNVKEDEEERENLIQKALESLRTEAEETKPEPEIVSPVVPDTDTGTQKQPAQFETGKVLDEVNNDAKEETNRIQLDAEQMDAYKRMNDSSSNMFITGKAGTGKSFLLEVFERSTKKQLIKLAPTGIAAINIGGATLHSTFGYANPENLQVDEISPATVKLKSEKQMILRQVDTIVIDEISMVRADTFDKIDRILRVINRNDKPFGGKQMIVFGDLFQLPPIAKRELKNYLVGRYGGIYFFQSDAYEDGDFKFIELSINHRQKDDTLFFDILNRMREGKIGKEDVDILNRRCQFDLSELRRVITLFPKKDQAEEVNRKELASIQAKEYSYKARIVYNGKNNQTPNLESAFPITDNLKLKLGALVMMTANDPEKHWVNGTLGVISFISDDLIKVDIDKETYEVKKTLFTEQEAVLVNGRIQYKDVLTVEQYPIVLAYAITIHKSQGMTYKKVACDISNCFAAGQAYVALSRCVSLAGLYLLNKVTESSMGVEEEVRDFYLMNTSDTVIS